MALRSMTGFGSVSGQVCGVDVAVEARSVNHRGLDQKIALPASLAALETRLMGIVRDRVDRGRVNVKVAFGTSASGGAGPRAVFDLEAARTLGVQLEALRKALGLESPVTLAHIVALPGAVLREPDTSMDAERCLPELEVLVERAVSAMLEECDREGEVLGADMRARLGSMGAAVDRIEAELPRIKEASLARLRERVGDMVAQFELAQIPEERLAQEVVLIAERSDIAEELTRARAHLSVLGQIIEGHRPAVDGPVGKKLDFYFQELIRETNTMGSKSQSEVIAGCVIEMRTEIDRLREQGLNIS